MSKKLRNHNIAQLNIALSIRLTIMELYQAIPRIASSDDACNLRHTMKYV